MKSTAEIRLRSIEILKSDDYVCRIELNSGNDFY